MQRLDLTSGSVTALVDRLVQRGLVLRHPDPNDRRGVLVGATPHGLQLLEQTSRPLDEVARKLVARYGADRTDAAVRYLSDAARICDWAATKLADGEG